jgi:hypothetical protein
MREVAVKQLSWPVWRQACGELRRRVMALAASHTSSGGRGTDGNMIGMSIAAIRPEGNYHIGSEAADDLDDLSDQYVLVNLLQHPITIVQAHNVLDTKSLAGHIEFLFPHLAKGATSGNPCTADLSRLTACR